MLSRPLEYTVDCTVGGFGTAEANFVCTCLRPCVYLHSPGLFVDWKPRTALNFCVHYRVLWLMLLPDVHPQPAALIGWLCMQRKLCV